MNEPHEVRDVEAVYYICGECGNEITTEDSEWWWHKDAALNLPDPSEPPETEDR